MPLQIFSLRGVPEDEADEIRQLLEEHGIDFYETPAGNWGVSLPALWLRDASRQQDVAQQLIERYQIERAARAKAAYRQLKDAGQVQNILTMIKMRPLQFVIYLALIGLILSISLIPILGW